MPSGILLPACLDNLSRRPFYSRMLCDIEMHQPPPTVADHDEHEQHSNFAVGAVKKSKAIRSLAWFVRNARHARDGGLIDSPFGTIGAGPRSVPQGGCQIDDDDRPRFYGALACAWCHMDMTLSQADNRLESTPLESAGNRSGYCPQHEVLWLQRWTCGQIAGAVGVSAATAARILRRAGLSRRGRLGAPPLVHRYEHPRPGDLLH